MLAGHLARMGEMKNTYKFWLKNLKGRDHSEDLDVDRKIILEWILEIYVVRVWIGFIWLRIVTSGGLM
jgi:hypothetical protein